MTRDKLLELLGWRLGDRSDAAARGLAEMDFVQRHVLEQHEWLPWFLQTEWADATLTVDEPRILLPDDFLAEVEESQLYISKDGGKRTPLIKRDEDIARSLTEAGSGLPTHYAISGNYFLLFCPPDYAYNVHMKYYAQDALMSASDSENLWLKHASDLVIAELGKVLAAKHFRDAELAASFEKDSMQAWNWLHNRHVARMETNQFRLMNGEG